MMGWQVTRYTGAFELKEAPVYWTDPLRGSFDVNVAEVIRSGTVFHVKIEENVVRPSGGGQAGDRGLLKVGDVEVEFMDTTREGESFSCMQSGADKPWKGDDCTRYALANGNDEKSYWRTHFRQGNLRHGTEC